ncbi:MAG: aminopeptidase P family protein [Polyangiaceae bacterium]|jgi:Xaa-Pro aminopeptidase|nr:aminopeptidase P family protein [Polyangiaceae bacterium]
MQAPRTLSSTFVARRGALLDKLRSPALLASGALRSRNYAANTYPFRANSHFLYLVGAGLHDAALLLADDKTTLFVVPEQPGEALWDGPKPSLDELRELHQIDAVRPMASIDDVLGARAAEAATLPPQDAATCAWLSQRLGRSVRPRSATSLALDSQDAALADAMIALRLQHDAAAVAQLGWAGEVTARAHVAGMQATRSATSEAQVFGAMMGVLRASDHVDAFRPIVSVHGEVLHNVAHDNPLRPGDVLLADVGGETPEGWAGDVTRVWPVSGTFSPTQRAIYEVVLSAEKAAIAMVRPGVRYRHVHDAAKRAIVQGLRDLSIFRGDVDGLLARGAAALFFPHGIGHLLGLDVHDMEDLGDRAGYAPGRMRSTAFGDCYLRLDRDLVPGMAVTIEPGFYQVPAIVGDETYTGPLGADLRRDELAKYADVRGIRIEDDVLVTDGEPTVLTAGVPKDPDEVERLVQG